MTKRKWEYLCGTHFDTHIERIFKAQDGLVRSVTTRISKRDGRILGDGKVSYTWGTGNGRSGWMSKEPEFLEVEK